MSELRADTITASNGTSPVTLTKQHAAKAWYNYKEYSVATVRDSFGISSMTNNGDADDAANFTNSFANVGYSASILATSHPATHYSTPASYANNNNTADGYLTSSRRYYIHLIGSGGLVATFVTGQFLGDLA